MMSSDAASEANAGSKLVSAIEKATRSTLAGAAASPGAGSDAAAASSTAHHARRARELRCSIGGSAGRNLYNPSSARAPSPAAARRARYGDFHGQGRHAHAARQDHQPQLRQEAAASHSQEEDCEDDDAPLTRA